MCHKLFQVYCCGHTKEVCTTPCTHAVANATPAPRTAPELSSNDARISNFIRLVSVLRHRPSVSSVASLPAAGTAAIKIKDGHSSQPAPRTSSLSNLTTPPHRESVLSTAPYPTGSVDVAPPPYTHTTPSCVDLGIAKVEMIPSYCAQFFARYLPLGSHPCYDCYMRPEYEVYRKRWLKGYADGHPNSKLEDVEELSGVAELKRKQRMVNGVQETNTAESEKVGQLHKKIEVAQKE